MMAASTNSGVNSHSPRYSGGGDAVSSPQSRRSKSPWTQIVRGESESVPAAPSSPSSVVVVQEPTFASNSAVTSPEESAIETPPESSDDGNNNAGKKQAWNKPLIDAPVEVGPVMGAVSWPALSKSPKASPKSSSESLKALSDGSIPAPPQGIGITSSPKHGANNANSNSTSNHSYPRQKSFKRGGGSGSGGNGGGSVNVSIPSNSGVSQPAISANGVVSQVPSPQAPVVDMSHNNTYHRDHAHRNNNWENGPRGGNDHSHQQRTSFRRGNGGSHPRGDGSYHHNGGRRDQDRGNHSHDWNNNRSFNGRDVHIPSPRGIARGFIRSPIHSAGPNPFISPQPVRPYGGPIGFHVSELAAQPVYYFAAPPEPLRTLPYVGPVPPHMFLPPAIDPQLVAQIATQIDYYFSSENLIKDTFLRKNMDSGGWVPVRLIATFKRIHELTDNINLILDTLQNSTVCELNLQEEKVRPRHEWSKWIMPESLRFPHASNTQSVGNSSQDVLAAQFQNIALVNSGNYGGARGQTEAHSEAFPSRSSSGGSSNPSNGEGISQSNVHDGSDPSGSSRNSGNRDAC